MQILKLLLRVGIVVGMAACSRTPLSPSQDAAAEVRAVPDAVANPDLAFADPDSATLASDTAAPDVLLRDSAAPDHAGSADLLVRDATGADAIVPDVLARDAAADVLTRDARIVDVVTVEAGADARDSASPEVAGRFDAREVAADPFAGRSFRIDDMNPAPTPDPTCTQSGIASAAVLTFGSDTTTLTGVASSGSTAFRFSATVGPESSKLTYHVTNLNGGQVFFERDQGVYVAQVVLSGSGVPVMWCLRGALSPQP